ncbi:hypothetical protein BJV78DRAFT_1380595 [Lactifluus subvellereus]|nr:hypothetical protein BJV78DRAFT_1380595 [Lactifluus subvellereus]
MLGNRPGSVTINSEAGTNSGQDKGWMGRVDPITGLDGNGRYPVSATNAKLGLTVV